MKSIFLFLVLAFSPLALGQVEFVCATSPLTTTFYTKASGNDLLLTVNHHNGVAFMPIHKGLVTPNDLDFLTQQADTLQKLGTVIKLSFDKSKCRQFDQWQTICSFNQPQTVNGIEISTGSLITSTSVDKTMNYTFKKIQARLSIRVQGRGYEIPMIYYEGDCTEKGEMPL